ncbi:MAG: NTP transferase domain-containing protein, partial [Bacteroidales bacterium]|nr:NTP transferase domain-containing protein [Bacteroidales bacterium]
MDRHVVIMAGGIGSRFWPVSTPEVPKQFVDILGTGRTLIQMTADRFEGVCPKENLWVVTGSRYVDIVKKQLPQLPANHILAEPVGRGTAPCIAYAGWKIAAENPSANIVFTPSDAYDQQMDIFRRIISVALDFTAGGRRIVTLGICPSRPETGYGYICRG